MNRGNTVKAGSDVGTGYISPFLTSSYPKSFSHNIYLKNVLEQPEEMISAIDLMEYCGEDDHINIHINSCGGSIDSLQSLLYAMERCPAHIHGIGSGTIASSATFVLINCNSFELDRFTSLLLHSASLGDYGKQQDVKEYIEFTSKQCSDFMEYHYKYILSETEIEDMIVNKKEIWLTAQDFTERFEYRNLKMQEDAEKAQEDEDSAFEAMFEAPPENILKKVNKDNLIKYIRGEVDIDFETGSITEVEDE